MRVYDRSEGNRTQRERLGQMKRGPGVFVYGGDHKDTSWEPTILKAGRMEPKFDDSGVPVLDSSGRQIYESHGQIVRDAKGTPLLGGPPEKSAKKLDILVVWGVEFPSGKPVRVDNAALALKLRCLGVKEVDGASSEKAAEKAADPVIHEPEAPVVKPRKYKARAKE
jgi:hypothetical protein